MWKLWKYVLLSFFRDRSKLSKFLFETMLAFSKVFVRKNRVTLLIFARQFWICTISFYSFHRKPLLVGICHYLWAYNIAKYEIKSHTHISNALALFLVLKILTTNWILFLVYQHYTSCTSRAPMEFKWHASKHPNWQLVFLWICTIS